MIWSNNVENCISNHYHNCTFRPRNLDFVNGYGGMLQIGVIVIGYSTRGCMGSMKVNDSVFGPFLKL